LREGEDEWERRRGRVGERENKKKGEGEKQWEKGRNNEREGELFQKNWKREGDRSTADLEELYLLH
jgi:hypothetical protein